MKASTPVAFLGGIAGALAVTGLNETLRKTFPQAPHMELLGVRAINKLIRGTPLPDTDRKTKYSLALGGDLITNATYYSLAGSSWAKGIALGAGAGVAGLYLPGPMGLGEEATNRTPQTQLMTVGYYLLGGLVTVGTTRLLTPLIR